MAVKLWAARGTLTPEHSRGDKTQASDGQEESGNECVLPRGLGVAFSSYPGEAVSIVVSALSDPLCFLTCETE